MELIAIAGPSSLKETKELNKVCKDVANILVNNNYGAIISPDKKSTAELFALEFKKIKGSHLVGIDYQNDTALGYAGLNKEIVDELIDCKTWENQPKTIIQKSKALVVLGLSVGVTWEICLTKFYWHDKKSRIFIITETNNEKLPKYLSNSLPIEYISIKELDKKIKELRD
jgi:hypothetical protein